MNLGFGNPLPLILARMVTQSGTAAAAWSGMWYGLAMGAIDAATRNTVQPGDRQEPERKMPAPPATQGILVLESSFTVMAAGG